VIPRPKYYADVCEIAEEEIPGYSDYSSYKIKVGNPNDYTKLEDEFLGKGAYAEVFKGLAADDTPVVIKYLKPIKSKKIKKEIKILETV